MVQKKTSPISDLERARDARKRTFAKATSMRREGRPAQEVLAYLRQNLPSIPEFSKNLHGY